MNREEWEVSENSSCNICGSAVEIGSASSRCSNRDCITRSNFGIGSPSTDWDAEDLQSWYEQRDLIEREKIDDAVESTYDEFKRADDYELVNDKVAEMSALFPFSSYEGLGDVRMEMEE